MARSTSASGEVTALSAGNEQLLADSLPAEVTTYVGRASEILEAKRLLESASVVTLTGPGGVGKTRLALRVAAASRADFADGTLFVPLAELHQPGLLVSTIAELLRLGDRSARPALDLLVDALRGRSMLLVLDNCEHLVDACAQLVDTLVRTCPNLVVLATSRQSLGVAGERILPVPPLAIPEPGESLAQLQNYDAVQLFVDRATAVVPSFRITEENAADVVQLCHQLDGLPLAIELAAVRLRALSVHQVTERLDRQFTLLTGAGRRVGPSRHETLRALIEWSYELCSEQERLLWDRLSVFAGSFSLDAAEAVCSGDGLERDRVLDVIDSLLDKSILLRDEQHGLVRYQMLETVRQYGVDRLRAADDLIRWQRRHRDWYLELTDRFAEEWVGPDQLLWIDRLRREHTNLRLALDFCARDPQEAVIGLKLAYNFKEYWILRGFNIESRIQMEKLLEVAPEDAPGRANIMYFYAFVALVQGDMPAYESMISSAAEVAEATDDEHARAYVLHIRAYAALIGNEMATATDLFGQATKMLHELGDLGGELWARFNYGIATALNGELEQGRQILRESIDLYTARGEVFWRSWALWSLAATEYLQGDLQQARAACAEVLRQQQLVGDRAIIAFALTVTAGVAAHSGKDRRAARLFGAAATVWMSLGASPTHYKAFVAPIEKDTDAVTGRLGWEKAAEEFSIGYAMSIDAAVAYALPDEPAEARPAAASADKPLTKRELQTAELVAKGMTNREIAQTLVISQRTAETHVEHILNKLGFTNRAQIAAWVVDSHR